MKTAAPLTTASLKTTPEMQSVVTQLAERHGFALGRGTKPYSQLWMGMPGQRPLAIRNLEGNHLSVARFACWDGIDPVWDPEAVFFVGGDAWMPVSFSAASIPGAGLLPFAWVSEDAAEAMNLRPEEQSRAAELCRAWADELRAQGWMESASPIDQPDD